MGIRSVLVIVWCVYLSKTSSAQNVYEFAHPGLQNCYYIDTYKTDFEPGDELVRSERSFFKKLFKNWGRWGNNECTQCCPNNAGYNGGSAGNGDNMNGDGGYVNGNGYYKEEEQYDNGYEPLFNPQDIPAGHHGHIYMPLPHPHRVMAHLHHYFNRPFRRGYGGKMDPPGNYPAKESPVEEKPEVPPPKEEPAADTYEEPAPVEYTTPAYTEKPSYSSAEKYDKKEEDADKSYDDKKYEKEEVPAPVTPQVIQPIIPIIAPPVYVYQPQYYTPPAVQPISYGQPYMYPTPPSPSYPATSVQYNTPSQAAFSYSLPAPTYTQATPPVTPVQYNPPPALVYPTPGPLYSPPASSYSQVAPPQQQPQQESIPTYTPPSSLSYTPSPPSALPELAEPTLPCPFSNPSDCSYFKKTYSTSLTYMLPPQSPSPPSSYSNTLTIPCYQNDQPMRSCPELFTTYQLSLEASTAPASRPY